MAAILTRCLYLTALLCIWSLSTAQDNYEIQVYDAETAPKGSTMFELHSNVTVFGSQSKDGVVPSELAWHETVEITQGITPWFEVGAYLFTSANQGAYWPHWVGDHIRPRFRIPEKWHWPLGLSLSNEIGYQRRQYCVDIWTWEIRPIIDKEWKGLYVSFNPVMDYAIVGLDHNDGLEFSPNVKLDYRVWKYFILGVEYYGDVGPFKHVLPLKQQEQQIGPVLDVDISPVWEINFGYIFGLTPETDKGIVKLILGRRSDWTRLKKVKPVENK